MRLPVETHGKTIMWKKGVHVHRHMDRRDRATLSDDGSHFVPNDHVEILVFSFLRAISIITKWCVCTVDSLFNGSFSKSRICFCCHDVLQTSMDVKQFIHQLCYR